MENSLNDKMQEILHEVTRIIQGWRSAPAPLERDLALEKLRRLYDMILAANDTAAPAPLPVSSPLREEQPDSQPEEEALLSHPEEELLSPIEILDLDEVIPFVPEPFVEEGEPEVPTVEEAPEPEELTEEQTEEKIPELEEPTVEEVLEPEELTEEKISEPEELAEELAEELTEEPALEPVVEPTPALEPEVKELSEVAPEREVPALENSLFAPSDIPVSRRSSRRLLHSLYGEPERKEKKPEKPAERTPEPAKEIVEVMREEPAEEQPLALEESPLLPMEEVAAVEQSPKTHTEEPPVVVGEAMQGDHLVVADTIPARPSVASTILSEGRPLSEMISLGESYMMIKELFYDDRNLYLQTLQALDQMESLEDCLIYIAENYTWNPNSEGVKRLQELLESKFGEN
uniref:hypothetical protein n=1 Tax=Alistipes sp. TaxID=1872444 RepID=UPI00405669FE